MISVSHLSMRYGKKVLFHDVSLQLNPGNHYGLIGSNGSGKSTFIKIILGLISSDSGEINVSTKTKMGSLSQDQFVFDESLILDTVLMGNPRLWKAMQQKHQLLTAEDFNPDSCHALEQFEKEIESECLI